MKPQTKNVAKALGAAVAGAAVGYAAGVLTAPAEGAETRRRIRRKAQSEAEALAYKAKVGLRDAKGRIVEVIEKGEDKVSHAMASFKRA